MSKFKTGDKVKVVKKNDCFVCGDFCPFVGLIGIVSNPKIYDCYVYVSNFEKKAGGCSGFLESDLELVEKKKIIREYEIVRFMRETTKKIAFIILSLFLLSGCKDLDMENSLKQIEIYELRQNKVGVNQRRSVEILTEKIQELTDKVKELDKSNEKLYKIIMEKSNACTTLQKE